MACIQQSDLNDPRIDAAVEELIRAEDERFYRELREQDVRLLTALDHQRNKYGH